MRKFISAATQALRPSAFVLKKAMSLTRITLVTGMLSHNSWLDVPFAYSGPSVQQQRVKLVETPVSQRPIEVVPGKVAICELLKPDKTSSLVRRCRRTLVTGVDMRNAHLIADRSWSAI